MTTLVRREAPEDDAVGALRRRVIELEPALHAREMELGRVQGDLDVFRARYRQQVGTLYEQLDALELAIAEAELGELRSEVGEKARASAGKPASRPAAPARFTSDAIRGLFRDVAKAIHPDLARDAHARDRRHALMIEANRAYADGDEAQLRLILESWERSPDAVQGTDAPAMRLRLERRVAQIEERMAALDAALAELKASALWELKSKVDEASAKGRDLVGEMVKRLKRDIMVATNRLDAMRPPSGPR
jgi:uncharacterized coiled-coil protein SlyX